MIQFHIEYANVLLAYIAFYGCVLFPMWKTRDIRTWHVVVHGFCYAVFLYLALLVFKQFWLMDNIAAFQVFKLLTGLPLLATPFFVFRKRVWQNIFLTSMVFAYNFIPLGIGNYAEEHGLMFAGHPHLAAVIVGAVAMAATMPPLMFLLKKLFETSCPTFSGAIWRIVWLLPVLLCTIIFLGSSYFGSFFSIAHHADIGFVVIRILVYLALLLICCLLHATIRQAAEMEKAKQKAGELAAKTDFYRKMSHDLRTPLTVVSTNIQTAQRRPEEAPALLTHSQDEIMKMAGMISEALQDGDKGVGE